MGSVRPRPNLIRKREGGGGLYLVYYVQYKQDVW